MTGAASPELLLPLERLLAVLEMSVSDDLVLPMERLLATLEISVLLDLPLQADSLFSEFRELRELADLVLVELLQVVLALLLLHRDCLRVLSPLRLRSGFDGKIRRAASHDNLRVRLPTLGSSMASIYTPALPV